jgi:hypothetical protein
MDNSPDMVAQAKRVLSRTMHYDSQIKDLDVITNLLLFQPSLTSFLFQSSLREHLGNFRAIEISIKDALAELNVCPEYSDVSVYILLMHSLTQRNTQRADQALSVDIPKLKDELQGSLVILQDLSTTLPRIRLRVANIRRAYNSGRTKVSHCLMSN